MTQHTESIQSGGQPRRQSFLLGITFMLLSGTGFSLMNYLVRAAGDMPVMQKSFFRNAISLVIMVSLFAIRSYRQGHMERPWNTMKASQWRGLLLRSFLGTVGLMANYYALDHLYIANASVLSNVAPFFTILFSFWFLGERVNKGQVLAIGLAFVGVLFISNPSASGGSWFAIAVAALGGLCAGGAYTCLRYLTQGGVDESLIIAVFSAFSCFSVTPYLIFNYQPMTGEQWVILLFIGIMGALGQYGITLAYRFAPASKISIFSYSNVLLTTIWGLLFLGEIPTQATLLGATILFTAFLAMFVYNLKLEKRRVV